MRDYAHKVLGRLKSLLTGDKAKDAALMKQIAMLQGEVAAEKPSASPRPSKRASWTRGEGQDRRRQGERGQGKGDRCGDRRGAEGQGGQRQGGDPSHRG